MGVVPDNPHREARRKAGFRTQAELAEAIGVHKSSIANAESGNRAYPGWLKLLLESMIENIELKKK